jgi:hypothetical protein
VKSLGIFKEGEKNKEKKWPKAKPLPSPKM